MKKRFSLGTLYSFFKWACVPPLAIIGLKFLMVALLKVFGSSWGAAGGAIVVIVFELVGSYYLLLYLPYLVFLVVVLLSSGQKNKTPSNIPIWKLILFGSLFFYFSFKTITSNPKTRQFLAKAGFTSGCNHKFPSVKSNCLIESGVNLRGLDYNDPSIHMGNIIRKTNDPMVCLNFYKNFESYRKHKQQANLKWSAASCISKYGSKETLTPMCKKALKNKSFNEYTSLNCWVHIGQDKLHPETQQNFLHYYAQRRWGNLDISIKEKISDQSKKHVDILGNSPLHYARYKKTVKVLLELGVPLNTKNKKRQIAVQKWLEKRPAREVFTEWMLKLYKSHGFDINFKDKNGNTFLANIAAGKYKDRSRYPKQKEELRELYKRMKKFGAIDSIKNHRGFSPADLAKQNGRAWILQD